MKDTKAPKRSIIEVEGMASPEIFCSWIVALCELVRRDLEVTVNGFMKDMFVLKMLRTGITLNATETHL